MRGSRGSTARWFGLEIGCRRRRVRERPGDSTLFWHRIGPPTLGGPVLAWRRGRATEAIRDHTGKIMGKRAAGERIKKGTSGIYIKKRYLTNSITNFSQSSGAGSFGM